MPPDFEAVETSNPTPLPALRSAAPIWSVLGAMCVLLLVLAVHFRHMDALYGLRMEQAGQLATERAARLQQMLARTLVLPRAALAAVANARSVGELEAAVRDAFDLNGHRGTIEFVPDGQNPFEPDNVDGLVTERLRALPGLSLRMAGSPVVSLDGRELRFQQTVLRHGEGSPRFWGYVRVRLPIEHLVEDIELNASALEGFDSRLEFQQDRLAPAIVLAGGARPPRDEDTLQDVSLSHGALLRVVVGFDPSISSGHTIVLLGVTLAFGMLLMTTIRLSLPVQNDARAPDAPVLAQAGPFTAPVDTRRLAERHLERTFSMLDSMLEHFPGLVIIKRTDDLRIARINRAGEQVLGRKRETLIGRSSPEIYAPDLAERMIDSDRKAIDALGVIELPRELVRMPGQEIRWIRYRKIALRDGNGAAQYLLEFGEDVTERERLYLQMREQVHFVEQLLESIPGALFYKNAAGVYLGVNSAFEEFMGISRDRLVGKTVHDVAPEHLADVYDEADRALLADGGRQVYESQVERAGAEIRDVVFYKAVFRATNGDAGGIVGCAIDISERKAAERKVEQLNRILTVLSEMGKLIVRVDDPRELLEHAGKLLSDLGAFPVVWIDAITPIERMSFGACCGAAPVQAFLERLDVHGTDPSTNVLKHALPIHALDANLAVELEQLGLRSMTCLPLDYQGRVRGQIGILGERVGLDLDESRLLEDLASTLARALDALDQRRSRRQAEEQLQLASRVFEYNAEGIVVTDAANRILMVNRAFTEVTGYCAEEVIGKDPKMLSSGRHDSGFYADFWRKLRQRGEWRGEIVNRRKNGEYYPEFLNISVVRNDVGDVVNYVAVFTDLTARKKVEERLEFLANYDPLTALPNRILFFDRLGRALVQAKRARHKVALFFLDLDRYKLINETVGHLVGDQLLREVSERLQGIVNDRDSVSRLGGDEFAIFISGMDDVRDAASYARRILEALAEPLNWEGQDIHVSASIGVSIYPDDGVDSETLAKNADSAMYEAMADGGNRARYFHQQMNERSFERVQMEGRLHRALDRGEFEIYYQPFVDAASGEIIGAEALLRWNQPDFGEALSPATFIPVLEDTGLIVPVGKWVLRSALDEALAWRRIADRPLTIAVNISALQLADDDFPKWMGAVLRGASLAPECLELELTESAVMRDPDRGIRLLRELRALGVKLSVDDFGTGYSSLSYLKQFPITTLKVDRSFVSELPGAADAATIVRAILAMGHALGLTVIAEGIETAMQATFLRDAGANILQGFRFAKPLPAKEFRQLLEERREFGSDIPPRTLHLVNG